MANDGVLEKAVADAAASAAAAKESAGVAASNANQTAIDKNAAASAAKDARDAKAVAEAAAKGAEASASTRPWPLLVTGTLTFIAMAAAFGIGITNVDKLLAATDGARSLLSVVVCFLGMAFACLGFGLFLVPASGAFKGSTAGGARTVNVETTAPGLVVIVCATIVIYFAVDLSKPPAPAVQPPPATPDALPDASPDALPALPDAPP